MMTGSSVEHYAYDGEEYRYSGNAGRAAFQWNHENM